MSALQRLQRQQQINRRDVYGAGDAVHGSSSGVGMGMGGGSTSRYDAYDDPALIARAQRRDEFREDDEMMFGPAVSRPSNPWVWE